MHGAYSCFPRVLVLPGDDFKGSAAGPGQMIVAARACGPLSTARRRDVAAGLPRDCQLGRETSGRLTKVAIVARIARRS